MELTNDQKKMDLVARLVKEGAIDFNEAIVLLEREVVFPYVPYVDPFKQNPFQHSNPLFPQIGLVLT